jgi:hypothetical protein
MMTGLSAAQASDRARADNGVAAVRSEARLLQVAVTEDRQVKARAWQAGLIAPLRVMTDLGQVQTFALLGLESAPKTRRSDRTRE